MRLVEECSTCISLRVRVIIHSNRLGCGAMLFANTLTQHTTQVRFWQSTTQKRREKLIVRTTAPQGWQQPIQQPSRRKNSSRSDRDGGQVDAAQNRRWMRRRRWKRDHPECNTNKYTSTAHVCTWFLQAIGRAPLNHRLRQNGNCRVRAGNNDNTYDVLCRQRWNWLQEGICDRDHYTTLLRHDCTRRSTETLILQNYVH